MNITDVTIQAFSDEIIKIALLQGVRNGFVNTLKEGWHGSLDPKSPDRLTWFGKGRQISPGSGRIARMAEEMSSLGGATRALPVGGKTLMTIGTGLMARDALRPVDPTGQNRSRAERLSGLTANTVGGLVGAAFGARLHPGLLGSLGGGLIGGQAAEKLVTAPFSAIRQRRNNMQPMPQEGV